MTPTRQAAGARNGCSARNLTSRSPLADRTLRSRPGSALIDRPNAESQSSYTAQPTRGHGPTGPEAAADETSDKQPERWVTKQLLAERLLVTTRWIESQQQVGLPYLRLGSINRYSITDVEAWLRDRYGRGG